MSESYNFAAAYLEFGYLWKLNYFCDGTKNGRRKKIDVREKFGDYLMDISKYVITAVLITMFFDDISSFRVLTYIAAIVTAVLTLLLGIVYYKKK